MTRKPRTPSSPSGVHRKARALRLDPVVIEGRRKGLSRAMEGFFLEAFPSDLPALTHRYLSGWRAGRWEGTPGVACGRGHITTRSGKPRESVTVKIDPVLWEHAKGCCYGNGVSLAAFVEERLAQQKNPPV